MNACASKARPERKPRPAHALWPAEQTHRVVVLAGRSGPVFYRVLGSGRKLDAGIAHRIVGPTGRLSWLLKTTAGWRKSADTSEGSWRPVDFLGEGELSFRLEAQP